MQQCANKGMSTVISVHLHLTQAVVLLGLILYGAGIISVNEKGSVVVGSPKKSVAFNSPRNAASPPSTPKRSKRGNEPLGTVTTPAGRRSARLARTRKED